MEPEWKDYKYGGIGAGLAVAERSYQDAYKIDKKSADGLTKRAQKAQNSLVKAQADLRTYERLSARGMSDPTMRAYYHSRVESAASNVAHQQKLLDAMSAPKQGLDRLAGAPSTAGPGMQAAEAAAKLGPNGERIGTKIPDAKLAAGGTAVDAAEELAPKPSLFGKGVGTLARGVGKAAPGLGLLATGLQAKEDLRGGQREEGMSSIPYTTIDDLPPRSDPETGLPRPPHAPAYTGLNGPPEPNASVRGPDVRPDPPPGQGPVLAWYQGGRYVSASIGFIAALIVAGIKTGNSGLDWITQPVEHWDTWAIMIASSTGFYLWFRRGKFSAGSDWLAKRHRWVKTYELAEISYHSYPWGAAFYLRDRDGRKVRYLMWDLGSDRLLWDLAYNGIAHSVIAGGAKTNQYARNILRLPDPEEIR